MKTNWLLALIVISLAASAQPIPDLSPERLEGSDDKTVIYKSGVKEFPAHWLVTVRVASTDNNDAADSNGGLIDFENAAIEKLEFDNWEDNCDSRQSQRFECARANASAVQWFNYVHNDEDFLDIIVRVPKNVTSIMRVVEVGGMGCGNYNTGADAPYAALQCAAGKTFIGNQRVSRVGGFPARVVLSGKIEGMILTTPPNGRPAEQPAQSPIPAPVKPVKGEDLVAAGLLMILFAAYALFALGKEIRDTGFR
jgi:hypothetical protein